MDIWLDNWLTFSYEARSKLESLYYTNKWNHKFTYSLEQALGDRTRLEPIEILEMFTHSNPINFNLALKSMYEFLYVYQMWTEFRRERSEGRRTGVTGFVFTDVGIWGGGTLSIG